MTLPYANVAVRDGALGIVPQSSNGTVALVGTCSGGVNNTVYSFTDIQTLKDTLGSGPVVAAAALILAIAGGTVVVCKAISTTAASFGAVVKVGTGVCVVTLTGSTPLDSYLLQLLIVQGGTNPAAGTATFKVSLDGGRTYGPETSVPTGGTYTDATKGLTIIFSAASLVAGDTYAATCVGPAYSTTDLGTAIDALAADPRTWFLLYAVGIPADATASQAVFALLQTKMATAATNYRFARSLMQFADLADAAIITGGAALADTRVMVAAGFANVLDVTNGSFPKAPAAHIGAARAAAVPPSEDLGRIASGAVKGVAVLIRDEFRTPGLDIAQYLTLRTHVGQPGAYITNPYIKAGLSSDFKFLQYARVMDIASDAVRAGMLRFLNDSVRVNATTGVILEEDARGIERFIESGLRNAVTIPGYASDCSVVIDRTVNVLSTQRLAVKFRVIPLGYAKYIDGDLGFSNPSLQPV